MHKSAVFIALVVVTVTGSAQRADRDLDERWWAVTGPDGVQRINIRCGADFFDPNHIVVRANVPVELSISTTPDLPPHEFVSNIPGPKGTVDPSVGPAQKYFSFVPNSPGNYKAGCRGSGGSLSIFRLEKQGIVTVIP